MKSADRTVNDLIISRLVRMNNSTNGNPRYQVVFTDGTSAPTGVDAMLAYGLDNSEYRGVPLKVTFNGRGHVVNVVRMADGRQL